MIIIAGECIFGFIENVLFSFSLNVRALESLLPLWHFQNAQQCNARVEWHFIVPSMASINQRRWWSNEWVIRARSIRILQSVCSCGGSIAKCADFIVIIPVEIDTDIRIREKWNDKNENTCEIIVRNGMSRSIGDGIDDKRAPRIRNAYKLCCLRSQQRIQQS